MDRPAFSVEWLLLDNGLEQLEREERGREREGGRWAVGVVGRGG